jgi:transcriptional regulator CtsR
MGISDKIETFIIELLKEEKEDSWIELKRNELASFFNCVPSQINYVISTRFNPEHGFIVESKRGGGGYVRIRRLENGSENPISQAAAAIGSSLSYPDAKAYISRLAQSGVLKSTEAAIMLSGISDNALTIPQPDKDRIRAEILKNMLLATQKGQ